MDSDFILIARLNASSKQAFRDLYDRYVDRVLAFVNSIIRDESAAEDITQTVFIQLWEHRKTISSDKNLSAWLYVSARNAALKEMRRIVYMEKYVNFVSQSNSLTLQTAGNDWDRRVINEELSAVVRNFPAAMRNIYELRTAEGMSVNKIAETLGVSHKTVETQLMRAKKKIREKLKNF